MHLTTLSSKVNSSWVLRWARIALSGLGPAKPYKRLEHDTELFTLNGGSSDKMSFGKSQLVV